jgi:hypothetical protein
MRKHGKGAPLTLVWRAKALISASLRFNSSSLAASSSSWWCQLPVSPYTSTQPSARATYPQQHWALEWHPRRSSLQRQAAPDKPRIDLFAWGTAAQQQQVAASLARMCTWRVHASSDACSHSTPSCCLTRAAGARQIGADCGTAQPGTASRARAGRWACYSTAGQLPVAQKVPRAGAALQATLVTVLVAAAFFLPPNHDAPLTGAAGPEAGTDAVAAAGSWVGACQRNMVSEVLPECSSLRSASLRLECSLPSPQSHTAFARTTSAQHPHVCLPAPRRSSPPSARKSWHQPARVSGGKHHFLKACLKHAQHLVASGAGRRCSAVVGGLPRLHHSLLGVVSAVEARTSQHQQHDAQLAHSCRLHERLIPHHQCHARECPTRRPGCQTLGLGLQRTDLPWCLHHMLPSRWTLGLHRRCRVITAVQGCTVGVHCRIQDTL